jgi:hypothetical protein
MVTISTPPSGTFGAFKPPEQKRKIPAWAFVAIFVVLVLGAAYYFYQSGFSLAAPTFTPAPPLSALETRVSRLPGFSFVVFDGEFYKSLKIYGAIPVVADSLGRVNPFVPF